MAAGSLDAIQDIATDQDTLPPSSMSGRRGITVAKFKIKPVKSGVRIRDLYQKEFYEQEIDIHSEMFGTGPGVGRSSRFQRRHTHLGNRVDAG